MSTLKITYLDGTELPNGGGNEQMISGTAADEILENNHIAVSDLPCISTDGTYRIEEN
jgi:hypothetical protein